MSKLVFRPEDFYEIMQPESASQIANAKLEQYLASCPVVYMSCCQTEITRTLQDEKQHVAISSNFKNSYYTARLVNVEKLQKDCKHEPRDFPNGVGMIICKHCGVELVAEWEAK